MPFRIVKTTTPGTRVFINIEDSEAVDAVQVARGNRDLVISVAFYESAEPSSRCMYALCFRVRHSGLEQARKSALEVVYYLAENCGIPAECIDLTYNGASAVADDDVQARYSGHHAARADDGAATPTEFVVLVPPTVFSDSPNCCVPLLNYDLARQMRDGGIENIDIDVYLRDHFVPMKDSIDSATGRFVVRVSGRDLLYLSPKGILDLSKQPRGDDCVVVGRSGEAAEWFAEAISTVEKRHERQLCLRRALLQRGWFISPCIRRLEWAADTAREQALEMCRNVSRYYSFVGAGAEEVNAQLRRICRRNGIVDYPRLKNIVAFGMENPAFAGCEHPLLGQFCPAGGCPVKELLKELKNPRLFV
jgi:hypothetical protein